MEFFNPETEFQSMKKLLPGTTYSSSAVKKITDGNFSIYGIEIDGEWYRAPAGIKTVLTGLFTLYDGVYNVILVFTITKIMEHCIFTRVTEIRFENQEEADIMEWSATWALSEIMAFEFFVPAAHKLIEKLQPHSLFGRSAGIYTASKFQKLTCADTKPRFVLLMGNKWYAAPAGVTRNLEKAFHSFPQSEMQCSITFEIVRMYTQMTDAGKSEGVIAKVLALTPHPNSETAQYFSSAYHEYIKSAPQNPTTCDTGFVYYGADQTGEVL